jgi:hypothetical protein
MAVENTQAYYDTTAITAVKDFVVHAKALDTEKVVSVL